MDLFDLSGSVSVVTGGNRGIGLGMAAGLAGAGPAVFLASEASRFVTGAELQVDGGFRAS